MRTLRTAEAVLTAARAGDGTPISARGDDRYRPAELVSEIVRDLGSQRIAIDLSTDATAADVLIEGSGGRFEALVQSVLVNALDHGEPAVPIRVNLSATEVSFVMRVSNRVGQGVRHRGAGLGTSVCARLALRMNATMRSWRRGRTYSVSVTLPLHNTPGD